MADEGVENQSERLKSEKDLKQLDNERWRPTRSVLAGIGVNMFGATIPIGWHMTIINAPQYVIKPFCNSSMFEHYGIQLEGPDLDLVWAFVVSVFVIGGLLGAALAARILDCFAPRGFGKLYLSPSLPFLVQGGTRMKELTQPMISVSRKTSFQLCAISHVIGSILFALTSFTDSIELIVVARLIVGFGCGLATCVVPTYLSELCPAQLSTVVSAMLPVGSSTGSMLAQSLALKQVLGNEESWHLLLALIGVPCLICLAVSASVPESPRYLFVMEKRDVDAMRALAKLRGCTLTEISDSADIKLYTKERDAIVEGTVTESWALRKIWETRRDLRMPVFLCLMSHVAMQLSGISAVFYYSTSVFTAAGLSGLQIDFANLGAAAFNIAMAAGGVWLIAKVSLRKLVLFSTASTGISLVGLALSLIYTEEQVYSFMPYLCVLFIILFVVSFGIGLGSVPFALPSDIIPEGPRTAVSSAGCALNWSTNFLVGMTFPLLREVIGENVFFFFASLMITVFVFFLGCLRPSYRLQALQI